MAILEQHFKLGPMQNNTYLLVASETKEAAVIDPSFGSRIVLKKIQEDGYHLKAIWLTHAHFDHIAGIPELLEALEQDIQIGLHPDDFTLWHQGGGAAQWGFHIDSILEPNLRFFHAQTLTLGPYKLEVRHTPGHTNGHVSFYSYDLDTLFCGDLIFYHSVGRTDFPGGDFNILLNSIKSQVFSLPPKTRLLSGHGPETSVEIEKAENPFVTG